MPDTTTIEITEEVTELSVTNDNGISVTLIDDPTVLTVKQTKIFEQQKHRLAQT